jgi:hypothetical protein
MNFELQIIAGIPSLGKDDSVSCNFKVKFYLVATLAIL